MLPLEKLTEILGPCLRENRLLVTDEDIHNLIKSGELKIEPDITDKTIQPATLDVRIGQTQLYNTHHISQTAEHHTALGFTDEDPTEQYAHVIHDEDDVPIVIHPHGVAKIYFHERLTFDESKYDLDVDLRSSRGRIGLSLYPNRVEKDEYGYFVHIINRNPNPVKLYGRTRFAQIFLHPRSRLVPHSGTVIGDPVFAASLARKVTDNPQMVHHYMVFNIADRVQRFKENLGIIDTKENYDDDYLYETMSTKEGVIVHPGDMVICPVTPKLDMPKNVGMQILHHYPLRQRPGMLGPDPFWMNVEAMVANAGWVDPNFKGFLALHAKPTKFPIVIKEGQSFGLGIFYHYHKDVLREYGHKDLESNYQHTKGEGFRS